MIADFNFNCKHWHSIVYLLCLGLLDTHTKGTSLQLMSLKNNNDYKMQKSAVLNDVTLKLINKLNIYYFKIPIIKLH